MLGFGAVGQFAVGDVGGQPSFLSQPLSEPRNPTNFRKAAIALIASGLFAPVVPSPAPVQFPSGWSQPPAQIRQVQYQAYAGVVALEGERVYADKWFNPLSEPVRLKLGLRAGLQRYLVAPNANPIVSFSWYENLSDPVRIKRWLAVANQQFFTTSPFSLTQPETVTESRWHQPWSEPVRIKPRLAEGLQQYTARATTEIIGLPSWYQWWAEPVRFKLGLAAIQQQTLALVQAAPFAETVTESRWHQPWSEPSVKSKKGLGSQYQQAFAQQYAEYVILPNTLYLQATETPDAMVFTVNTFGELLRAEVSIVEVFPIYANTSTAYVNRIYADVSIVEVSS